MNITFLGRYNKTASFGLFRDTKKDPYTKNKYGLVNNYNNKELAALGISGTLAGVGAGSAYNDIRAIKETNKRLSLKDLDKRIKGNWKAKALGAAIGGSAVVGTGLLLRKTRKDKGKKRK